MGVTLLLTPVVIGSWPVIVAAASGAAASLGLAAQEGISDIMTEGQTTQVQNVEMQLEESQIESANLQADQEMLFVKDGIEIKIKRDVRGKCSVCAHGKGYTETELKSKAQEFIDKFTQCYVYNKVVTELKEKNFQVLNQEISEDETVSIHVRRWED